MSLRASPIGPVPEATARVAYAAFPRGSAWLPLRDVLGPIYEDATFTHGFRRVGDQLKRPGAWHWSASCNSLSGCPTERLQTPCAEESIGSTPSGWHLTIPGSTPACCASSALACWQVRQSSNCWMRR